MGISFRILLYDRKIRKREVEGSYRRKKRQGVKDSRRSIHILWQSDFTGYLPGGRKTKRADFFDRRLQMSFVQIWEHPSAAIEMRICSADGVRNASIQIFFGFFRWNRSEGRLRPAKNSQAARCGISSGMRRVCGFSGRYGSGGYLTECGTLRSRECRSVPAV